MNWIPITNRLPTRTDADKRGYVLIYLRKDRQWSYPTRVGAAKWDRVTNEKYTHWAVIDHPDTEYMEDGQMTLEQRIEIIEDILKEYQKQKEA